METDILQFPLPFRDSRYPKIAREGRKRIDSWSQDLKDIIDKTASQLSEHLCAVEVNKAEKEIKLLETKWLIDHHLVMNDEMWDSLNRKMSILDIDIGEQEVILRTDLDVCAPLELLTFFCQ